MKRKGKYKPTMEGTIELSGVEILHPGGMEMTRRTAELKPGMQVLDVSSCRGTCAAFYAKNIGQTLLG